MKSLDVIEQFMTLLEAVLADAGTINHTSMARDLMTIKSRVEHEGLSFLTISLPSFAKAFEQCLEKERIDSTDFLGFKKHKRSGLLPAFLQGLISQVFNVDGSMRLAPNPDSVEALRQICLCFNKVKFKCTPSREKAAEKQFISTEREVSRFRLNKVPFLREFRFTSEVLYKEVFDHLDNLINRSEIIPFHGPGSTVDKTLGNKKFKDRRYTERLHRIFPFDAYKTYNLNDYMDHLNQKECHGFISRRDEPPVRVVFVPKTMKTPRVIAIEPVWIQHIQQGIMREIVKSIENDKVLKGHINFSRQDINRSLAFKSSLDKSYATIDLSEASDRVHPSLVKNMMRGRTTLSRAIFACRSERAKLPSGKVISLSKFASQGSALCFPVEAMIFYSVIVSAFIKHNKLRLSSDSVRTVSKDVFVYGDDIIVPNAMVDVACQALEDAGLKVNRKKSFSNGQFRESCGMDAFAGVNVTPVYVRHPMPSSKRDTTELIGLISASNQFYLKGYWKVASFMRLIAEKILGVVPHVRSNSSVIGWHSVQEIQSFHGWNADNQTLITIGYSPVVKEESDPLDGYHAMIKWSTMRAGKLPIIMADMPLDESSFLSRAVRGKLRLRRRWSPA